MARSVKTPRRKPRLRTELSELDERRLQEAVALFGLPKAEVVRRLMPALPWGLVSWRRACGGDNVGVPGR